MWHIFYKFSVLFPTPVFSRISLAYRGDLNFPYRYAREWGGFMSSLSFLIWEGRVVFVFFPSFTPYMRAPLLRYKEDISGVELQTRRNKRLGGLL